MQKVIEGVTKESLVAAADAEPFRFRLLSMHLVELRFDPDQDKLQLVKFEGLEAAKLPKVITNNQVYRMKVESLSKPGLLK